MCVLFMDKLVHSNTNITDDNIYVAEDVILCYDSTLQVNFCSALWNFYLLFIHEMVLLVHMSDWLYRAIDVT